MKKLFIAVTLPIEQCPSENDFVFFFDDLHNAYDFLEIIIGHGYRAMIEMVDEEEKSEGD